MKKSFLVSLCFTPFLFSFLASCESNNIEKDNYSISEFTTPSDITNIWYYNMGGYTSTILTTDNGNYKDVYSKFLQLTFKKYEDYKITMNYPYLEFYEKKNALNFSLILSENYICILKKNKEKSIKYIASSSSEYYLDIKFYLDSMFTSTSLSNID